MARKIKILQIHPEGTNLSAIEIAGDFTKLFQGRFYIDASGNRKNIYESASVPIGYESVIATTFSIIGNAKYNGTYTVHTPVDSTDAEKSSIFLSGNTTIRVNETIGTSSNPSDLTDGYITNISTYLIRINDVDIAIPPRQPFETTFDIKLYGKDTPNWGEGYAQNFASLVSNFSSNTAPTLPQEGQLWFQKDTKKLKIWFDNKWNDIYGGSGGGNSSIYKHTQATASKTWTVTHSLSTEAPYVCIVQVYVDRGLGPQQMMPSNIKYDTADQLTITFTTLEKGWALIQA